MVWDQGVLTILGSLGGGNSRAWSVNDAGVIIGQSSDTANILQAMISLDGQNIIQLSDLVIDMTGWTRLTVAYGINELGQIVGTGSTSEGVTQAFLLAPNVAVVPIPTAAWLFGSALGLLGWMQKRGSNRNRSLCG
jgi:probable HAF family extracellular repeat protein